MYCLEPLGIEEGEHFCFVSFLGENFNYGLTEKEGMIFTK